MTFGKAIALEFAALCLSSTFDVYWVVSGKLGTNSYIPGIYPLVSILAIIGTVLAARYGLWNAPTKK